jgi:L-2-hydroxyglutarate oxidase
MKYDITIIGAGIVGLATAFQLSRRRPGLKLCVIDKEQEVAAHQTGHNSGVIHSGIYYRPGGSKALNCRRGYRYLLDFCDQYGVPYDLCGKVIVATREEELPRLDKILETGRANGLEGIRMLSREETLEIEPHVRALRSILVPQAGIVNYRRVAETYWRELQDRGAEGYFGARVGSIEQRPDELIVHTSRGEVQTERLITCGGLYSDKLIRMTQDWRDVQVLPFRGEYYELTPEKQGLVNNLIYPVPNPNFPFLGVHFTRMIEGGIEAGPNAVLAFSREGYSRWDVNMPELWETLRFPGFRKIALRYWQDGLDEMVRSYSKRAFVKALQHLIPEVGPGDLHRGGAGVRAMACDRRGNLIDDFLIVEQDHRIMHVGNAPSPAATASLAIGEIVAEKLTAQLAN